MTFAAPLGLLALLAVPAVLVLHLFRRRLRRRRVAGTFLFAPDALVAQAGRRRTRLLRTASLWLELAAAVLLALCLAGPVVRGAGVAPHLVFVLDGSASMSAATSSGESAADRARREVEAALDAAGERARVTIVVTGARPEVLCGPRAATATARGALGVWRPALPAHDARRALDLAFELGDADAKRIFLTDGDDAEVGTGFDVVAVGRRAPNAAILHANRSGEQLACDVALWDDAKRSARVEVEADGSVLVSQAIELDPERPVRVLFEIADPAERPRAWRVGLEMDGDALALDDHRVLLPDAQRPVRVGVELDADSAARLALERAIRSLALVSATDDPDDADLVVTASDERSAPRPGRVELVVAPSDGERDAWLGPYWIERPHPLTDGLSLDGVVWTAGSGELPGVPIVAVGERSLLTIEEFVTGASRIRLDLDPARTNLTSAPDWPILLQNVTAFARERASGVVEAHVVVGDEIRWRRPFDPRGGYEPVTLVEPAGETREAQGVRAVTFEARRTGLHRLVQGGEELGRVAVSFVDPQESDLRARRSFVREAGATDAEDGPPTPQGGDLGRWIALLVFLVVLADWWVLGRGGAT